MSPADAKEDDVRHASAPAQRRKRKSKQSLQQGKVPHGIGEYNVNLGRVGNSDVQRSHQHADRQRAPR